MDVYDPQTLGIVVFSGFMVVSAIGIALVSTLSMKETSYEEALANQRRELAKTQPLRGDKKKKALEKKGKAKKKEEKPNGKLPEHEMHDSGPEPGSETSEPEPESEPESVAVPEPVPVAEATAVPKLVVPEPKADEVAVCYVAPTKAAAVPAPSAPSPREKKKRKVAKVDPAPAKPLQIVAENITKEPVSKVAKGPVPKEPGAKVAKEPGAKVAKEPGAKVAKEPGAKVAKEPGAKVAKEPGAKVAKEPVPKEPGAKVAKEPGAKVAKEPGAKVAKEPGAKVAKEPGAKVAKEPVPKEPGAKVAKEPVPKEPGAKVAKEPVPKEPGAKVAKEPVPKEPGAKVAKEPVPKEPGAKAAKVVKEAASKIVKEPAAKVTKELVSKAAKETVTKELAAKAAKEPVAKESATKVAKEHVSKETAAKVSKEPVAKESIVKASKESVTRVAKEPNVKIKGQSPKVSKEPVGAEIAPMPVALAKAEEPKSESTSRKKSKKKVDAAVAEDVAEVPLLLPFKTLVATLSNSVFSESETQKLLEIVGDKAGADTWQLASQKGDPLAALKKQLEEKGKLLSAEQENAAAAKTRLRELTKELSGEKSKTASVETRLSSELSAREQEMVALHARMKASYDEHTAQTQQLNSKIQSLQEQLENGPNAQLARLQQENTILRDALNQATSLAESRQNAELAKLRQDCVRLSREANERAETLHAEEERRKALEAKVAVVEEQLTQAKAARVETEHTLQQKLERVEGELHQAQDNGAALESQLEQSKKEAGKLSELQEQVCLREAELKDRCTEVESLKAQLAQVQQAMPIHLEEQVTLQTEAREQAETQGHNSEEQLRRSLTEREGQVMSMEVELKQLREELEAVKTAYPEPTPNREGGRQEDEAQSTADLQLLQNSLKEKEDLVASLEQQLDKTENSVQQLQASLAERESRAAEREAELKKLRDELDQQKAAAEMAEAEQPFESLEKDARLISLEEELQALREEAEQARTKSNELREKNYAAVEALAAAERLGEDRLIQARKSQNDVEQKLHSLQMDIKDALQNLFPHVTVPTEQSNWLEAFIQKAQESLTQTQRGPAEEQDSTELTDALQKLREAEESQTALQAQCEQYRATLSQTESILKDLQRSVEERELTWKSQVSEAERQWHEALAEVKLLEETAEILRVENQSTEQLKGQVVLLEAQLEKQLESISSSQTCAHEVEQLKILLSTTQAQLESAQSEAQKQHAELLLVRQQLQEATECVQRQDDTQPSQAQEQLVQTEGRLQTEESARLQMEHSYEQALRCVRDLEAQLVELQAAGEGSSAELKEKLEKEARLTQDLGEAASTLQRLLRSTQEELSKEREAVKALQEQLQGQDGEELKEGTSV
ncbi:ribosome-binding protein 1b isoform X3 [Electrophorus electricus]|uniref:ribosome-binding protein 1b isoform X3 n=1 Tax=Electrophorus electricus TaxID=8005 RepID=UPI0015D0B1AF|nr:ribosome-binding protein 1b isoform X3 [Electrophorus electricus]